MSLFDVDDEIESVLFIAREISLYRVPPMSNLEGYKADTWGLANPLWKGRLRIIEKASTGVTILLEDSQTGAVFARAPYKDEKSVQPVLDSSRYFVIRVEDATSGNKAFLGIGYADRSESFDFNVALQDYDKRKNAKPEDNNPKTTAAPAPKLDFSLKDGQTFSVNIPGARKVPASTSSSSTPSTGGIPPLLPPPPPGGRKR